MSRGYTLTIYNDHDEIMHESEFCTLGEIARVFDLKNGSDLSHYRGRDVNKRTARQRMLKRWGIWFVIKPARPTKIKLDDLLDESTTSSSSPSSSDDEDE